MSKHTPGPWRHLDDRECSGRHDILATDRTVATIKWYDARSVADARLIAAAPEMLDALREVEEFLEDQAEAEYFTDRAAPVPNRAMQLLVEIREAIDKATGGRS